MFAAKKKKKKSTTAKAAETGATDASLSGTTGANPPLPPSASAGSAGAPSLVTSSSSASSSSSSSSSSSNPLIGALEGEVDETYEEMLSKVYVQLTENNPELLGREKKRLKPPQVSRVGTTRTAWTNFKDICAGLKRAPDHILSFFLAELGTTGAIDGSDRLLLKGKYQPKYVESLLRKYIQEFVQCHMCRNVETELRKDADSRLYFMDCKACGSSRSVAPIKAGFHATSKGDRKKAREAMG